MNRKKEIEECTNKIWDVCCKCVYFESEDPECVRKEENREYGGCAPICFGIIALIISTFFIYFL